jgi:hypothetical protein
VTLETRNATDDDGRHPRAVQRSGNARMTGRDGKWIQARTKGAGHGSRSRAFYARTHLVQRIFETGVTD